MEYLSYILPVVFLALIGLVYFFNVSPYMNKNDKYKEGFQTPQSASGAHQFAENAGTASQQLADSLLISKYRTDYENSVTHLISYVNDMMVQTMMQIDTSKTTMTPDNITLLNNINTMNQATESLQNILKYVDSV